MSQSKFRARPSEFNFFGERKFFRPDQGSNVYKYIQFLNKYFLNTDLSFQSSFSPLFF